MGSKENDLRNTYSRMTDEELVSLLTEGELRDEARKILKQELQKRNIGNEEANEIHKEHKDAIREYDEQIKRKAYEDLAGKKGAISREVACKKCGFEGVVEAHDTQHYPKTSIFKLLGKNDEGYIHFMCPSCRTDNPYSPVEFLASKSKSGIGRGCFAILVIVIVVIWLVIR